MTNEKAAEILTEAVREARVEYILRYGRDNEKTRAWEEALVLAKKALLK